MNNFNWDTIGTGNINIILLNGWAVDSKIWFFIINKLDFFLNFI
ncbi:hypothetical protein [Buchnera aphidicola]|nr:hypothetical protein [Buchnera aphidicola]